MAGKGRPKAELLLTGEERETLERWARRPTSAQALAQRCRIVLACAEGLSNQEAARSRVNESSPVGVSSIQPVPRAERDVSGVLSAASTTSGRSRKLRRPLSRDANTTPDRT